MTSDSRRWILLVNLAFLPVRLVGLIVSLVYMIATVPLLLVCVFFLLLPAELLWVCSPFVGLVYPPAGAALANTMEWAGDALTACMDFIWAPLDWIGDATVFYEIDG